MLLDWDDSNALVACLSKPKPKPELMTLSPFKKMKFKISHK